MADRAEKIRAPDSLYNERIINIMCAGERIVIMMKNHAQNHETQICFDHIHSIELQWFSARRADGRACVRGGFMPIAPSTFRRLTA